MQRFLKLIGMLSLGSVLATTAWAQSGSSGSQIIVIKSGLVTAIDDVEVPAKEAGPFAEIRMKSGQAVRKGDLVGRLDDTDATIKIKMATAELEVAKTQGSSQAEIEAAKHTEGAALKEFEMSKAIRQRNPESISLTQLRRDELQWLKSIAQIEVANVEYQVRQKSIGVKAAQLEAAQNEFNKRQIKSPVDGEIVEIYRNEGEWVQLGERVFRIVRLDKLRVEGFVNARDIRQESVRGRPVKVTVFIPEQPRPVELTSVITFASSIIEASNEFRVFCDIENLQDSKGDWVISPGARAELSIDLGRAIIPTSTSTQRTRQ